MGCCGQGRNPPPPVLRPGPPAAVPEFRLGTRGAAASARGVLLRCREQARVLVRGPVTGRAYEFSAQQPVLSVEPRDAELLLRTRQFVRA
ncbi:MAG TPA: hypothetical protein VMN83_13385 [Albitalea sp.]|nr:hypothetical protein [Albitalea sp.]